MSIKQTRIAQIELIDDTFFYIRYNKNVIVTREEAAILTQVLMEMKLEDCPRIYHYTPTMSFDFDAIRELSASTGSNAIAVVYDHTISTDILETLKESFIALDFKSPISYFESKKKAIEWIKSYC